MAPDNPEGFAPNNPVSNYLPSQGDAVALLQQRGAPLTPYNLRNAMQILATNPHLRPTPTSPDAVQGAPLPAMARAFPTPTAGDENAVSEQMNGGQSMLNQSADPSGVLDRALARKPPAPTADVTSADAPDVSQGGLSLGALAPSAFAVGGAALLSAMARRRGITVPMPSSGARAPEAPGVVSDSTTAASASRSPSPADPAPNGTSSPGKGESSGGGKDIPVNDGSPDKGSTPKGGGTDEAVPTKGSSGVNLGVNAPDASLVQNARKNLRDAKAAGDYAKARRYKGILSRLEGGGSE